jgi:hypothetical protein
MSVHQGRCRERLEAAEAAAAAVAAAEMDYLMSQWVVNRLISKKECRRYCTALYNSPSVHVPVTVPPLKRVVGFNVN